MDLMLTGQTAVVAGAARGIGAAIAAAFVAEGASVVCLDRDAEVRTTAERLAARAVVADVTDYPTLNAAAAAMGRVEHVVFAVAIGSGKFGFPFWNLEPSDWPRVLEVNVVGAANVAHAFAPTLVAQRSGSMLFLASVAG